MLSNCVVLPCKTQYQKICIRRNATFHSETALAKETLTQASIYDHLLPVFHSVQFWSIYLGVDVNRFMQDNEYKRETVLGLAM